MVRQTPTNVLTFKFVDLERFKFIKLWFWFWLANEAAPSAVFILCDNEIKLATISRSMKLWKENAQ